MKRGLIGVMGALVLGAFGATASTQDAKVEKGAKVYADQTCSMWHAIAGKGNTKGALDDVGSKFRAEEIRPWPPTPVLAAPGKRLTSCGTRVRLLPWMRDEVVWWVGTKERRPVDQMLKMVRA